MHVHCNLKVTSYTLYGTVHGDVNHTNKSVCNTSQFQMLRRILYGVAIATKFPKNLVPMNTFANNIIHYENGA